MSNLTEKAIKASFLKLLDLEPLSKITVRDITDDCGINRNSFYYHFHDIPQLMEQIALDQTNSLIEAYPDISSLEECVEVAFRFIVDNRRSINHIYHSLPREVFEQYLMRICEYSVTTWFNKAWADTPSDGQPSNRQPSDKQPQDKKLQDKKPLDKKEKEMKLRFIRYELFGACVDWMNQGMPPEVMGEVKDLLLIARSLIDR